jgi:hypothetical protein
MNMFVSKQFALMALSCCITQLAQAQNAPVCVQGNCLTSGETIDSSR